MPELDIKHLQSWVGKEVVAEDTISPLTARAMAAALDRDVSYRVGDPLPPAWHWLYFHEVVPASRLGADGHPKRGGFIPPVPLPRRMWAGGRLIFARPLRIGERAIKRSTIKSVTEKQGRSGQLCFVVAEHQILVDKELCLSEEQDLVYREAPTPGSQPDPKPAPAEADWSETVTPDPVFLFRYSAVTFNGHRIHYDVDYCRDVEGYPGLVVHGPLIATLLLDLVYRRCPNNPITGFDFRAASPLFDTTSFSIHGLRDGNQGQAWATNAEGGLAMTAQVRLAS